MAMTHEDYIRWAEQMLKGNLGNMTKSDLQMMPTAAVHLLAEVKDLRNTVALMEIKLQMMETSGVEGARQARADLAVLKEHIAKGATERVKHAVNQEISKIENELVKKISRSKLSEALRWEPRE